MKKVKIEDILKPQAELKSFKIDITDPKVIERLKEMIRQSDAILKCKEVDWDKLSRTYITI